LADAPTDRIGTGAYVVGGLAFIPLAGVAFGIVAVIWGLASGKQGGRMVALLGALGIAFTVALYGGLIYFGIMERGGVFDDLRGKLARGNLDLLVKDVEFLKTTTGNYPDTLDALHAPGSPPSVQSIDPYAQVNGSTSMSFFYQRIDEGHYYLRSVGPDGTAFTADDVLPTIVPDGKIGLVIERKP